MTLPQAWKMISDNKWFITALCTTVAAAAVANFRVEHNAASIGQIEQRERSISNDLTALKVRSAVLETKINSIENNTRDILDIVQKPR